MSEDCPPLECDDCKPWFEYSLNAYPISTNEEMTIFVPCPTGYTCGGATVVVGGVPGTYVTIPPGTITLRPVTPTDPVADTIVDVGTGVAPSIGIPTLNPRPRAYANTVQSYTASCPPGKFGNPVTITIPAGTVASLTSQADANAQALAIATNAANQALCPTEPCPNCYSYTNTEQTANCPEGYTGDPVTIPAGTVFSNVSQQDADDEAMLLAETELDCTEQCDFALIQTLTWTFTQNGSGASGSGSGSGGTLSVNENNSCALTSNTITNTCGVPITFTVTADWTLRGRTINFITDSPGITLRTRVNGVDGDTVGGFTTTQCGTDSCPCESQTNQTQRVVTIQPGDTIRFLVSIGQDVGTAICGNGTASFNITSTT